MGIVRGSAPFTLVDEVGTDAEPVECGEASSRATPCLSALAAHRNPATHGSRHNLGEPPSGRVGQALWCEAGGLPERCEGLLISGRSES